MTDQECAEKTWAKALATFSDGQAAEVILAAIAEVRAEQAERIKRLEALLNEIHLSLSVEYGFNYWVDKIDAILSPESHA